MQQIPVVFLFLILFLVIPADNLNAQEKDPNSRGAFLRSMAVPGWGHYYAGKDHRARGQVHIAAEIALVASYFGMSVRAENLENQYVTFTNLKAGVDISARNRAFRLAVGEFASLEEYNDFQLRSRNWHRLFDDIPRNRWEWENADDRQKYQELRSDSDRIRNQLPAIAGLMVVNRLVSGISALNRTRRGAEIPEVSILPVNRHQGIVANLQWRF
ncbi:MAG: hypothetical protein WD604_08955 [Balneolaceae bacterium]